MIDSLLPSMASKALWITGLEIAHGNSSHRFAFPHSSSTPPTTQFSDRGAIQLKKPKPANTFTWKFQTKAGMWDLALARNSGRKKERQNFYHQSKLAIFALFPSFYL